ncbi:glycosyl hydrolase [Roseomonas sp. 18066]|uniref:glycosyl hydrolase n=1 Tax=Roseomonas sp. 18066 TaxID=2681412 RepID=UPI00135A6946|nr:glycosyl hydrolase [Roseomonas sp. 18066]
MDAVHGVVGGANWWDFTQSANWAANDLWKGIGHPVLWSVPLLVWDGRPTLEQAATGAFNNQYRSVAQSLLAGRQGDNDPIYVRTGWENNLPNFPWTSIGHEDAFIGAFRQFVDSFRDVSSRFKFEWNINHTWDGPDPMRAYPGDAYVDVMGMDIYWNVSQQGSNAQVAWNQMRTAPHGLEWFERQADIHNKPTAYSEWGVDSNEASFIKNLDAWFESHDVVYQSYWNASSDGVGKLTDWHIPTASQAYRDAFRDASNNAGNGGTNQPSTPAPTTPAPATPAPTPANPTPVAQTGRNDTYYVNSESTRITEAPNGGIDTVVTWVKNYTLPDNVENLTFFGTGWSTGTGNSLNNTIIGNDAPNRLNGGGGADRLTGAGGADTFVIGKGQGGDVITDFHPHAWGGAADTLLLEGFGSNARVWNSGNVVSIQAQDGSVTQVTLEGVTSLGARDYIFA